MFYTAISCEIVIILLEILCMDIMASSGQKKSGCGHIMASFDTHIRVASRMRFPRDRALIRLQTQIFLESAVTKLYENA